MDQSKKLLDNTTVYLIIKNMRDKENKTLQEISDITNLPEFLIKNIYNSNPEKHIYPDNLNHTLSLAYLTFWQRTLLEAFECKNPDIILALKILKDTIHPDLISAYLSKK